MNLSIQFLTFDVFLARREFTTGTKPVSIALVDLDIIKPPFIEMNKKE
jgi:hypothetical protein